jgi:putative hemolysin
MFRRYFIGSLFLVSALALAGCQTPVVPQPTEAGKGGMANPASVYCEEQGGRIELREGEGGTYGVCIFEDGSECDEWAFYRGECKAGDYGTAPEPAHVPRYVNEQYGFSLDPSPEYAIEERDHQVLVSKPGYLLSVTYKSADEEVEPFRTGTPAGEFQDGGTVTVLGAELPKQVLVYEGKVKTVSYGLFQAGDLLVSIWLDAEPAEGSAYAELDIPVEVQGEADQIVATFSLTSGETPEVTIFGGG